MAGLYPDVPGPSIPFDRDGTGGFYNTLAGGTPIAVTPAQLVSWNDWTQSFFQTTSGTNHFWFGLVFPALMDLNGMFFSLTTDNLGPNLDGWAYSTNTTTGADGTWTTITITDGNANRSDAAVLPYCRSNISPLSITGVRGIRAGGGQYTSGNPQVRAFHVYGTPSSGQAVDRLRLWHPTLDQAVTGAHFDYSEASRTYTYDKTFRIKNNSATLTANSVAVTFEALTDASPTVVSQLTVSQGGAFAASQTISSIAAGAISAVCTARLTLVSNAALGLWRQRILANAGSWT